MTRDQIIALRDGVASHSSFSPPLLPAHEILALCDLALIGLEAVEAKPVAWRYRYLHKTKPSRWTFTQSFTESLPATAHYAAIEADGLILQPARPKP
jgi:hypothetical protein